jgi:hypothetical protein
LIVYKNYKVANQVIVATADVVAEAQVKPVVVTLDTPIGIKMVVPLTFKDIITFGIEANGVVKVTLPVKVVIAEVVPA